MIKIGICDDELSISAQLEKSILDLCIKKRIKVDIDVFDNGGDLEKEILKGAMYDLLYLDIQLERGDGIETAKHIRQIDENVIFIFISGYDKYLMELFRLDVFTFIKKPIDPVYFNKIFLEAYERICHKKIYYTFKYKSEEYKVLCNEIMYFESSGRKIKLYMRNGKEYGFNGKLSEVAASLAGGKIPFLRIHQSYLVNFHLIISRCKSTVKLINGQSLPISEDRQKEFTKQYGTLLRGEIDV